MRGFTCSLVVLIASTLVSGCVAPAAVRAQAETILIGQCRELFLAGGVGDYQHVANAPTGVAAFALASDNGMQSCGYATNYKDQLESAWFSMPNADRMEAVAIARCEARKPASIKAPCRTFARNNEIVWEASLSRGLR